MTPTPPDDAERTGDGGIDSGVITVVLAEDHHLVAQGLATMLSFEDGIEVLDIVGSGEELLSSVETHKPVIALVDISLKGMDGLAAVTELRARELPTRPIALSMYTDDATVRRAVAAGVAGYLPKDISREELVQAVRAVAANKGFLHADVTRPLLQRTPSGPGEKPAPTLSAREQQVLEALASGLSTAEIADALQLGTETVKTHLSRLYRKLNAADRVQAVVAAMRKGLVR